MRINFRRQKAESRKNSIMFSVIYLLFSIFSFLSSFSFAQTNDIEFSLDVDSPTVELPKIFKANIDLSGRGAHYTLNWPQNLSAAEALDIWQKDIGFSAIYRIQFNLWEINERSKDGATYNKLLAAYEEVIKKINDSGGIVILNIFGTPAGFGKILDKKSSVADLKPFKELIKKYIKELSCNKKYNIWYEVWNAPDDDEFFLGRKQDYFAMYRVVSHAIKELEAESKINIPIGGPSSSWWFQNRETNSILTPERSLIYELIKYCYNFHLPLDFITWHTYTTDPKIEFEVTKYNKTPVGLIREWLSYFHFDRNTPLIVDEWNYDSGANLLSARQENAFVAASFIPARLKSMYEAGLDHQLYFCLEDFQGNKEHVVRNVGVFMFDPLAQSYKGKPKSIYGVFKMLSNLGKEMYVLKKSNDEFTGIIASKGQDNITLLIYNYIDRSSAKNYLSRNVGILNDAERKTLLTLIKTDKLEKIVSSPGDLSKVRSSNRLKSLLKKAQELNSQAGSLQLSDRNVKLSIKNLKVNYLYQRYTLDSSCALDCEFKPVEEKEINGSGLYQETLAVKPYSVEMIVLKIKPPEPEIIIEPSAAGIEAGPSAENGLLDKADIGNTQNNTEEPGNQKTDEPKN